MSQGLIIAIIMSGTSQVPGLDYDQNDYVWSQLFWYGSTVCFVCSVHIIGKL